MAGMVLAVLLSSRLLLPPPGGSCSIGRKTIVLVDSHRKRELPVTFWYPALAEKSEPAPYMDPTAAAAVADALELQPNFQSSIETHSHSGAPVAAGGPFPVMLLEHGSGSLPALYSILAEGLASSGFIVAATNHPGEALISVFPDGHVVRFKPYWPIAAFPRLQAEAMGKYAESVLAEDVRFVLGELTKMNHSDSFWRGRLDLTRVGIVGHSLGGTTAAIACREDPQILAGANLDGPTFPGMAADGHPFDVHKPFLFIVTGEHARSPSHGREYAGSAANTYYVTVNEAIHRSFMDSSLLVSRFARTPAADDAARFKQACLTTGLTKSLVIEFFGKYLKGATAPHLDLSIRMERK